MVSKYITIKDVANATITEKRSQFIATIMPITDENDAANKINEIRKLHRDAKHNVYACRLINGFERFSDDGEPSGTAGKPILDIIKGENIQNVLVVVTRYFGGILLGTGGLVRAYSNAVKEAKKNMKLIEMILCDVHKVTFNYTHFDLIQFYCNENNFKILNSEFLDNIVSNIIVPKDKYNDFISKISDLTERSAITEVLKTAYFTHFE
jgi:uncharacterized YigZ family protein